MTAFFHKWKTFCVLLFSLAFFAGGLSAQACDVESGDLTLYSEQDFVVLCTDDEIPDTLTVLLEGNSQSGTWFTTTPYGVILEIGNGPFFDFGDAEDGTCFIFYLVTGTPFTGEVGVGDNVCALTPDDGCWDLSNYIRVTKVSGEDCEEPCEAEAGEITFVDDELQTFVCADGTDDEVEIIRSGSTNGTDFTFIITDLDGNIVDIPAGDGPFDFEPFDGDILLAYFIALDDQVTGLVVGGNLDDLSGCFELSNPLSVVRQTPDGGELEGGPFEFCAGDGEGDFIPEGAITVAGATGSNFAWVVTDEDGTILGLPDDYSDVNFDGAGPGNCLVWYMAFEDGLEGAVEGANANDLEGCFDLSNPITVVRNQPDGGTLEGGPFTFCAGDGEGDFIPEGAITVTGATGSNFAWVVTDADGNILGLPENYADVDFDGAGNGTCLVWYLAFEDGLEGAVEGANANDLAGCFDLSNPIEVIRNQPNGGIIEGGPFAFCIDGQTEIFLPEGSVTVTGATGSNFAWVLTDEPNGGQIQAIADDFTEINVLEAVFEGYLWYLAFEDGLQNAEPGFFIEDLVGCFNLSNPLLIENQDPFASLIIFDSIFMFTDTICLTDSVSTSYGITFTGGDEPQPPIGEFYECVVTDTFGNIMGFIADPDNFSFDGAEAGICDVYCVAYFGELGGFEVDGNINNLEGCFEVSNSLRVVREEDCDSEPECQVVPGELFLEGPELLCINDTTFYNVVFNDLSQVATESEVFIFDINGNIIFGGVQDITGDDFFEPGAYFIAAFTIDPENFDITQLDGIENFEDLQVLEGCFAITGPIEIEVTDDPDICGDTPPLVVGILDTAVYQGCMEDQLGGEVFLSVTNADELETFVILVYNFATGEIVGLGEENQVDYTYDPFGTAGLFYGLVVSYDPSNISGLFVGGNVDNIDGDFAAGNLAQIVIGNAGAGCLDPYAFSCGAFAPSISPEDPDQELCFCLVDGEDDILTVVPNDDFIGENFQFVLLDGNTVIATSEDGTFNFESLAIDSFGFFSIQMVATNGFLFEVGDNIDASVPFENCFSNSGPFGEVQVFLDATCGNSLAITEVTNDGTVEVTNFGSKFVGLTTFYLATGGEVISLNAMAIECGDLTLAPLETVVLRKAGGFNMIGDELALFANEEVSDFNNLIDYVRWGGGGLTYVAQAIMADQWSPEMNLPNPMNGEALQLIINDQEEQSWQIATPSPCELNNPVGVFDPATGFGFELFPNPVSGAQALNVRVENTDFSELQLEVFDQSGRKVNAGWNASGASSLRIEVEQLPAGVYFLRLTDGKTSLTDRFTVQR